MTSVSRRRVPPTRCGAASMPRTTRSVADASRPIRSGAPNRANIVAIARSGTPWTGIPHPSTPILGRSTSVAAITARSTRRWRGWPGAR